MTFKVIKLHSLLIKYIIAVLSLIIVSFPVRIEAQEPDSLDIKALAVLEEKNDKDFFVENNKIEDENEYWRIDISYPKIDSRDGSTVYDDFNNYIRQLVTDHKNDFEKNARIMFLAIYNGNIPDNIMDLPLPKKQFYDHMLKWGYDMSYYTGHISSGLISIRMIEQQDRGSKEPKIHFITVNYDNVKKREILLAEMFKPNIDYFAELKKLFQQAVYQNDGNQKELPDRESWDKYSKYLNKLNIKQFEFADSALIFHFEPGVLNPQQKGYRHIVISYQKLLPLFSDYVKAILNREFFMDDEN